MPDINSIEQLMKHVVSDEHSLRSSLPLLQCVCEYLLEYPNRVIDLNAMFDAVNGMNGFVLSANQRTHLRRLLKRSSDDDGPIVFIAPSYTHLIFFNELMLTRKEKAVRAARFASILHLSSQFALPSNFNQSISDIDHHILTKLKVI